MLLSIKSGALICFASVILGAALITARTHYSGKIKMTYSRRVFIFSLSKRYVNCLSKISDILKLQKMKMAFTRPATEIIMPTPDKEASK